MTTISSQPGIKLPNRVIGKFSHSTSIGPTAVFFTGVHGNEPAGVLAAQRVVQALQARRELLNGSVLFLAGNLQALEQNRRYLGKDLNRIWQPPWISLAHERRDEIGGQQLPELVEQIELLEILEAIQSQPKLAPNSQSDTFAKQYYFDLHTTSAASSPFLAIDDRLLNRQFALRIPAPTIFGLEEFLMGTLLTFLNKPGRVCVAFEAGQHDDPASVDLHESFIWLALVETGILRVGDVLRYNEHRSRLAQAAISHQIFEVIRCHRVTSADQFAMNQGYRNFDPIHQGEEIAKDRQGSIKAQRTGQIFMPLYQAVGEEGFFEIRPVPHWAIVLSAIFRHRHVDRVLKILPGIHSDPRSPDVTIVNRRIARWLALQFFHLLGYRRLDSDGKTMRFIRRD